MAKPQPVPEDLQRMLDNPEHCWIIKLPVYERCRIAYGRITDDNWGIEKTCGGFQISSTWYRKMVIRNGAKWGAENKKNREVNERYNRNITRFLNLMGIISDDGKTQEDAFDLCMDALHETPLGKKVILDDEEGECYYDDITDDEILSLKDQFWIKWNEYNTNNNNINKSLVPMVC